MIDRIKEIAFLCFTLSLVVSYFACLGYFSFFNIDITSFLSIEDLTMIFAKWIWLSVFFVAITVFSLYSFSKRMGNEKNWWNKTIGNTLIKRRAIIAIPLAITVIISAFIFKIVADILEATMGIVFLIMIIVILIAIVFSSFKNKKHPSEIIFKDWFNLMAATSFFIFIIPFICGAIAASKLPTDKIYVKFDDDHYLSLSDSTNLIYIGKTADYFFITNSKTKTTTAYSMNKVKSFEVIISKK